MSGVHLKWSAFFVTRLNLKNLTDCRDHDILDMSDDYYHILGIAKSASESDVKKAYVCLDFDILSVDFHSTLLLLDMPPDVDCYQ